MTSSGRRVFEHFGEAPIRIPSDAGIPLLKDTDPEHKRPQLVYDGECRVFDTSKPEDVAAYSAVAQRVARGNAFIILEDVKWSEARQTHVVLLRWMDAYQEIPELEGVRERTFT